MVTVTPVRERGLKSSKWGSGLGIQRHSREGAWIEIILDVSLSAMLKRHSREGAWIEMPARHSASACSLMSLP